MVYLSLHIPCPLGTVLKAASEVHKDSSDSLYLQKRTDFHYRHYGSRYHASCYLASYIYKYTFLSLHSIVQINISGEKRSSRCSFRNVQNRRDKTLVLDRWTTRCTIVKMFPHRRRRKREKERNTRVFLVEIHLRSFADIYFQKLALGHKPSQVVSREKENRGNKGVKLFHIRVKESFIRK